MASFQFKQVDVFTHEPLSGNPVAVVFGADSLDSARMQAFANWTNLSETTFVLAPRDPEADYRLRIFTPTGELPFAGHPTIGSAHAILEAGLIEPADGCLIQECGVGLVPLHRDSLSGRITLHLPRATLSALSAAQQAALDATLGGLVTRDAHVVDLGPRWLTAEANGAGILRALKPDMKRIAELSGALGVGGITLFGRDGDETEVRSFAPLHNIPEDPVCGSGNGAVAALLRARGDSTDYVARQGRCVGRDGRVYIEFDRNGVIRLGGHAVTCIDGTLSI